MRRLAILAAVAIVLLFISNVIFTRVSAASTNGNIEAGFCESGAVFYLGKDNITQGDWQNALRSPIGVYGSYAHILPNPPKNLTEISVGNFSVPVGGFDYTDYGWTPNQISGLPFNRTDPTYWDEYVSLDPKINYTLNGTLQYLPSIGTIQYPVFEWAWDDFNSSDPRAAHFKTFPPNVTRLTCWDDGSERDFINGFTSGGYFNVTLDFPKGVFMLSLYAYDISTAGRPNQTIYITNEAGEVLVSAVMEGAEFDGGIYLQFLVCGPTTIVVQVMRGPESVNAVLSGIFVDKLSCEWRQLLSKTTIVSCDIDGNEKHTFLTSEDVYVKGDDFIPDHNVTIYIIPNGQDHIPANAVTEPTNTTTLADGSLPITPVWNASLYLGEYDIWVDVNQNGIDDCCDVYFVECKVYLFHVIPEYLIGSIGAVLAMFGSFALFRLKKKTKLRTLSARLNKDVEHHAKSCKHDN